MRLRRTTASGVYYESTIEQTPDPEFLEALDALAEAAAAHLREEHATDRGQKAGAPSLGLRPGETGYRIRPAAADQDPDPEDDR